MDNTLVSARVPKAKKEAAAAALKARGATMSDLINGAIDQLVEDGALPSSKAEKNRPAKESFRDFVKRSTLDISWPSNPPDSYKDLERSWRRDDYESLA